MKTQVIVDTGGRVLIPKELRNRLRVEPGDLLEISELGGQITLKPMRQSMPLEKQHGFWIYTGQRQSGETKSIKALIFNDREARINILLPKKAPRKEPR